MKLRSTNFRGEERVDDYPVFKWISITLGALILLLMTLTGLAAGCREYNRYQKRAEANNKAKVTNINIKRAREEAKVRDAQVQITRAEARQRIAEAEGIRKSQDLIAKTLTPLYIQHEAIEAQKKMAGSPNHTQVYIPTGPQGIPQVKTVP